MANPILAGDVLRLTTASSTLPADYMLVVPAATNGPAEKVTISNVLGARGTTVVTTTATTVNASTTLVNVTGLTANVLAGGTYVFDAYLATTTVGGSGGTKAAMGGTATWASINTTTSTYTASAVAVNTGTTATPGTSIAGATAANIQTIIKGTVVVNAAGTLTVMFAQNASDASNSVVLANSWLKVTKVG